MANQYVNQVGLADGTILLDVSSDTAARTDVLIKIRQSINNIIFFFIIYPNLYYIYLFSKIEIKAKSAIL